MESVSFDGYNGDTVSFVFLCFVFVFFVDCCFFGICVCVSCIDLAQNTLINTAIIVIIVIIIQHHHHPPPHQTIWEQQQSPTRLWQRVQKNHRFLQHSIISKTTAPRRQRVDERARKDVEKFTTKLLYLLY